MKLILAISLLFSKTLYAQKNIIVLDSITNKPLPFAEIIIGSSGSYTNEKGIFVLDDCYEKTGIVSFLGYKKRIVNFTKIDTIFLSPKQIELDEIVITSTKRKSKIDFLHINKRYFGSFPLMKETEILTKIKPINNKIIGKVESVSFKLDKITFRKKIYAKSTNAFIRINIYTNDSTLTQIFSSKPYKVKKMKKDLITINLSKKNIKISKEGLVFGIEYIGHTDENGNFVNNNKLVVRPCLTDRKSSLYNQSTLIRNVYTKKIIIQSLHNYFHTLDKKGVYSRNLSISFEISK